MLEKLYFKLISKIQKKFLENDCEVAHVIEPADLIILVKDKMIGERIYDVLNFLKESGKIITAKDDYIKFCMKIESYFSHNHVITGYQISFSNTFAAFGFNNIRLQAFVKIVLEMGRAGYFIDMYWFQYKKNYGISELFSIFTKEGNESETAEYLIRYCHFYLSESAEDDFDEFYSKLDKKIFFEISDMPYGFYAIRMCYQYYLNKKIPDIFSVIELEKSNTIKYIDCICVKKDGWKNLVADAENEESAIYGNIKIFKIMNKDFEKFLTDCYSECRDFCSEISGKVVIDLDGNPVGYESTELGTDDSIFDAIEIKSQSNIFDFFHELIFLIKRVVKNRIYETYDYKVDVDKIIGIQGDKLYFKTFEDLFQFLKTDPKYIKNQIAMFFCNMLKKYLDVVYGEICSKSDLFEKDEIRYLSPIITNEFIKFYFNESVNYLELYESLSNFISSNYEFNKKNLCYFDKHFAFSPFETKFNFDFEIEKKYKIKLKPKMVKKLPDGRTLVIRQKPITLDDLEQTLINRTKKINHKIGDIENEKLNFITIDEFICSTEVVDNMYICIGYITNKFNGKVLSKNVFLNLNHKELMYVFGYFFSNFSEYTFYFKNVHLDNNIVFYIDILDENFMLKKTGCKTRKEYVEEMIKYIISIGYNQKAFWVLDDSSDYSKDYFITLANSFDKYCDEHGIYYSGIACPVCLKIKNYIQSEFQFGNIIFEDNIAKHYEFDSEYNLKIYNPEVVDLAKMKESLESIILTRLENNFEDNFFIQDCFIPEKVAYDSNRQFIGYIYKKVDFFNKQESSVCIDLKDQTKMKNLHRIKALMRLISQVEMLIRNGYVFSNNPYSHVFLSKTHKKQVQILNIDFLERGKNSLETIKWTYDYILEVIDSDENICLDKVPIKSSKKNQLKLLYKVLEDLANNLTKYCTIHNEYYDKSYLFCPKCLEICKLRSIPLEITKKDRVTSLKQINKGGESIIFEYDKGHVAKVFKESGFNYDLKSIVITKIMEKSETIKKEGGEGYRYIFPQNILVDEEDYRLFGYVMKKVEGYHLLTLGDKSVVKEELNFSRQDVLEILINVGKGIEKLHSHNIFIGDLNGKNILFDKSKEVYFLDFDGMGVDFIAPEFCTDGYIDPISKKNKKITPKDDWYSFAIQAFYYLTYTHPFNGIYEEDGKSLDIIDKMEKRISLLGDHEISIPKIAEPWDWMNDELKSTFYQIFEKELRVSIVPNLISQYRDFFEESNNEEDDIQSGFMINQKFMAKSLNYFEDENVIYVVNLNVAICQQDLNVYAIVLTKNHKYIIKSFLCLKDLDSLKKIEISEDECYAFEIVSDNLFVIDLKKDACVSSSRLMFVNNNVVVNRNTVYFIEICDGEFVIHAETWGGENRRKIFCIKVSGVKAPKFFNVENNQKFVIVKKYLSGNDVICCNDEKNFYITCNNSNTKYNIIYDEYTKTWLVINEKGDMCVIKNDGNVHHSTFDVSYLGDIANITYVNGKIYFPCEERVVILNAQSSYKCKEMKCHKIMKSSSKICKITQSGFYVITDGVLYEVYKA